MAHVEKFQGIPMSKSMRGICKEEDYAFLGTTDNTRKMGGDVLSKEHFLGSPEHTLITTASEEDWRQKKEERGRQRLEREQRERKRLQQIEECKKEKAEQWRSHIAELAASQNQALGERLTRLRRFREFQKTALAEEAELNQAAFPMVDQNLTRM